ncbi:hypothetical protein DXG03_004070 [Asterophora parasitica]|uniref:Epoxide hydrolase N-terminal domain-containing protein n=1 Tax=Asterophora parasitica TaxID=117018 RepID=A0A9P7KD62_9AGAR|nr:hypothetical protein DXG03_004070 [Asterophora parasitica]
MISPESPFQINISDAQLTLLQQKLANATFPDELEEAGSAYGAPLTDIKRLVACWKDGYDWLTRDVDVEGFGTLNIHYVHKKSAVDDAIPLLFVHGWPGSFIEVRKILPLLVEPSWDNWDNSYPNFHVVAFNLPSYGFSDAPKKKGFGVSQYAEMGNKLMLALGYDEYVTQGSDWGHLIIRKIAHLYGPKHCKAWHTNMVVGPPPITSSLYILIRTLFSYFPIPYWPSSVSSLHEAALANTQHFLTSGQGYSDIQCTRPQTLGYGLADWIYEKLMAWTDAYSWEDDEVLTWISIYHFSRAGPAALVRIYFEAMGSDGLANEFLQNVFLTPEHTTIPLGYSHFPKDMAFPKSPNLVFEAEHDRGGHFASYEEPVELVGDLRKMFGRGGGAYGVVSRKDGYAAAISKWL